MLTNLHHDVTGIHNHYSLTFQLSDAPTLSATFLFPFCDCNLLEINKVIQPLSIKEKRFSFISAENWLTSELYGKRFS